MIDNEDKLALIHGKKKEVVDLSILAKMQKLILDIQTKGRELCMHEAIASKNVEIWVASESSKSVIDGSKCPISIGKAVAESACTSMTSKQELALTSKQATLGEGRSSGK